MLVLSRKIGEWIIIGDNVRVKIVEIRQESVRIGIEAPRDIVVDRREVHEKKKGAIDADRDEAGPVGK